MHACLRCISLIVARSSSFNNHWRQSPYTFFLPFLANEFTLPRGLNRIWVTLSRNIMCFLFRSVKGKEEEKSLEMRRVSASYGHQTVTQYISCAGLYTFCNPPPLPCWRREYKHDKSISLLFIQMESRRFETTWSLVAMHIWIQIAWGFVSLVVPFIYKRPFFLTVQSYPAIVALFYRYGNPPCPSETQITMLESKALSQTQSVYVCLFVV